MPSLWRYRLNLRCVHTGMPLLQFLLSEIAAYSYVVATYNRTRRKCATLPNVPFHRGTAQGRIKQRETAEIRPNDEVVHRSATSIFAWGTSKSGQGASDTKLVCILYEKCRNESVETLITSRSFWLCHRDLFSNDHQSHPPLPSLASAVIVAIVAL